MQLKIFNNIDNILSNTVSNFFLRDPNISLKENASAFDMHSIDITRLLERCHRIIKRSSDNLPGGLFMSKSPKK